MVRHDNKGIRVDNFRYQLTKWVELAELDGKVEIIKKAEGDESYGVAFVVKKKHPSINRYAIYVREKRKEVRKRGNDYGILSDDAIAWLRMANWKRRYLRY